MWQLSASPNSAWRMTDSYNSTMGYKKRIFIIGVLIAILLGVFWLDSRYPAIDEKAAMAGETVMGDVLSFEAAFKSEADDPLLLKIGHSTVNWVLTNRQGMTFGVLLATLILTLLQTVPRKHTPRRTFRDIMKGVLIGAPLGVCVNCAAPIAYGMRKEGVRNETSLAVMFASPTLNIIVLAMMFSVLPMYLALTKLVVTFVFLLLVLPLLLRWFFREAPGGGVAVAGAPPSECLAPESWKGALNGLARDLARIFVFIVLRTVPLMILAGLLGAAMAHLLPLDSFTSWPLTLGAMGAVALLGTFAPVPIAFDVVLVQALLVAGLPPPFAAVLLITLGMFSIYPLMLVARMMTARFALILFAAVTLLGVASGYFTGFYGDGWPDLALAENTGVRLMRNVEGERFEPVELKLPKLAGISSLVVAFVDIDDDGCQDLFVGAFGDADYFVINDCRGFENPRLVEVAHEKGLMTQAAGFFDTDGDGDLDWVRGNWFFLIPRTAPSGRAVNYLVENQGDGTFRQREIDDIIGETLTVLLSDFDSDGYADLVIGNDYMEPDFFYRGAGAGQFSQVSSGGTVPISTMATMSIDSADIDNDLDLDLFLSGKVNDFSMRSASQGASMAERRQFVIQRRLAYQQDYCKLFKDEADRERCAANFASQDLFRRSRLEQCKEKTALRQQDECMITLSIKNALIRHDWTFCGQIAAQAFPVHKQVCDSYAAYDAAGESKVLGYKYLDLGAIDQKDQGNVLLVQQEDGEFLDRAEAAGVGHAFWAWNAKFADLDHDEWQDLYVANGWWVETSLYSNNFFRNTGGGQFEPQEAEFGLVSKEKQCCYTLLDLDLDRDGDLDIVSRSLDGVNSVFINGSQNRNALQFEFRDEVANHFGIGNRITIFYGKNDERHQVRELKSGGGFASFDGPVAHFGLGEFHLVNRIEIRWSDGEQSEIRKELGGGNRYVVSRSK